MHKCTAVTKQTATSSFIQEDNLLLRDCRHNLVRFGQVTSQKQLTVNLAGLDIVADILGAAAIDLAADGEGSTQDLEDGAAELLGHRALTHGAGDLDDVVQRDRLGVLDVLLLLAITGRLLKSLDDQGRRGGHNRDGGLTVLDGEPDRDTETLLYSPKERC